MEPTPRVCLHCGKPIKNGRQDRKFCDEACKNEFHNQVKLKEYKEMRKVDLLLKKNRRVLKRLFNPKNEKALFAKELMLKHGFEFEYHTHIVITKTLKNEFTFCYDYGYRPVEKDRYQIIKSF